MGMGLEYKDTGPELGWHLTQDSLKKLRSSAEALPGLSFQKAALQATRRLLPQDKSLIGFVAVLGPCSPMLWKRATQGESFAGQESAKIVSIFL